MVIVLEDNFIIFDIDFSQTFKCIAEASRSRAEAILDMIVLAGVEGIICGLDGLQLLRGALLFSCLAEDHLPLPAEMFLSLNLSLSLLLLAVVVVNCRIVRLAATHYFNQEKCFD